MFLEIEKDGNYINREAISQFYYNPESRAYFLFMTNGRKFEISKEIFEILKEALPIVKFALKKESAE